MLDSAISATCSTICRGKRSRKSLHRTDGEPDVACARCDGTHWVCENHPKRPWDGPKACGCGGAGEPCPDCNDAAPDELPVLPEGFEPDSHKHRGHAPAGEEPAPEVRELERLLKTTA